ncbi:tyrosine--tRNA ligase [candidate division SR1 bacterium]|nr:tyrosine--tRNA ligase [candidate division SR1 bacterium]
MNLREELQKRDLLYQFTSEKLFDLYDQGGEKFYCGYDPTADSLHLGHLLTIMTAVNFMKRGNTFVMLIGGATGFIGDPTGKTDARIFIDEAQLHHNQESISRQIQQFMKNLNKMTGKELKVEFVNNYDFVKNMSIFDFFTQIGKYITVNTMLTKESIKKRIEDPDLSLSFTEFSYMLLQGYDFLYLNENQDVKLQIGGSDQRGNMVTGTEMIRKKLGGEQECYVMTIPLMLDSTGKKFGKSEGNAVWLDPQRNTPYFVYQFFMNTMDVDVPMYLKAFTLMELGEIDQIITEHQSSPELRFGQQKLASYVVEMIFGHDASVQAEKISKVLFGEPLSILQTITPDEIRALGDEIGSTQMIGDNTRILDLLVNSNLASSNAEAKKLILAGSVFFNEQKITDIQKEIKKSDLISGIGLLRKGKKSYKLILWTNFQAKCTTEANSVDKN